MLLQKIITGGILIGSGFLLVSCFKDYEPHFFNGEWMSDSLVTKENDHWREFLYFDNGQAARTTSWGKKYLLNKNLQIKGLEMYDRDKALFQIKVLDSNRIIVKGKDYYGSFYRNNILADDMKKAVFTAEEVEKQRKRLLGDWKTVDFKIVSLSTNQQDTLTVQLPEQRVIAGVPTHTITSLNFGYNKFSLHCNSSIIPFSYRAEQDKIEFGSGDVIDSFKYYFQEERLIIEYCTFRNILNTITFEKVP
ncbi:hypothetical protein [Chryseobacterium vrystaatense]|uniref:Lipocalin-like domain-containing protein n=1 Tax=Chryseobacterium vrystaatense TaxID=307480 RepID=A0A1M5PFE8_9FLAO|nr:hypothetical protein [Chryseobacterium vrystaatense]SHH00480.1 hypothetical protein SAMN02787073_0071 [Chryseobacterium vrystaatense]